MAPAGARPSLREPGAILLVSTYELGHAPHGIALPMAFLERAGFRPAALDLAVEPFHRERAARARLVALSVPMHTALRLGLAAADRTGRRTPAPCSASTGSTRRSRRNCSWPGGPPPCSGASASRTSSRSPWRSSGASRPPASCSEAAPQSPSRACAACLCVGIGAGVLALLILKNYLRRSTDHGMVETGS